MTPEAVIDRYLETATREPLDPVAFAEILGTDADLLSRWLQLVSCPAEPSAFVDSIASLSAERFRDLAISQALSVLSVSGSVRLSFDQWQSVLSTSLVGELLATELGLEDPVAVRWRVLLAASGVNLAWDPVLTEMLAFRGARRELLEDASVIHRLLAAVESLDLSDPRASREAAQALLGIDPERYEAVLHAAGNRCAELLDRLGLSGEGEFDSAERLWLRLQIAELGHLFRSALARGPEALLETHTLVSRRLFGQVPELLLVDESGQRLQSPRADGPEIAIESRSSAIARSARLGERTDLSDRSDQAVADRQVLRRLGGADAVCLPLQPGGGRVLGVLVFALDEDVDHELAMGLYAEELARHLAAPAAAGRAGRDELAGFRQRHEKRLRELVHEANNPLSIVNNYLHILELKLAHEPEAVDQLRLIGAELRRAGEIINQIREVPGELETSPQMLDVAELDLNTVARRVVELHGGYARDHDVELAADLAPDSLLLRSDEDRLTQILINLVRNAVEAARGARVTVSTAGGVFREGREGVLLGVADTGPGLPREVLVRLSEPKESTKGGNHAGLGLHIVHRLIAELGGSIDVRTGAGQGTTFSIFLPLDRPGAE